MKRLPNIKQLQYLVALHEHQHFGRAAEACYISQSTLSAAILHLEEQLGAQLLERSHKLFLFTPLGEEIVRRSRLLIEQGEELNNYVINQKEPMHGTLRVGIIPTIAPFIVTDLLAVCRQQYPALNLLIREDTTDNAIQHLEDGKLDMIVFALPYPIPALHTRVLCKDYFQLVLPKEWLNKDLDKNLDQLPKESLFLLEKEHCLTGHTLQGCHLKDNKIINPFFATSLSSLREMVRHQPGITYLPTLAINKEFLLGTDLHSILVNSYREIAVAWRSSFFKKKSNHLLANLIEQIVIDLCKLTPIEEAKLRGNSG